MRRFLSLLVIGLASTGSSVAQSACGSGALAAAAKAATGVRHQLHLESVDELDPKVPAAVAAQLGQLKAALADAAKAAFACAPASAEPDELQKTLAAALDANVSGASESVYVTQRDKDLGAYGSDLAVQVFSLFNSPRYYEVDFRFGVECGDDNLLMVFRQAGGGKGWDEVLRWGAPSYNTVADAYGDFVLLTPLSGSPGKRNWRFVVAHGQPGCNGTAGQSRFDIDVLEPTDNPSHPQVVWHLERPYVRSMEPRLASTEDTLTFELWPRARRSANRGRPPAGSTQSFRYRISNDNEVEPESGSPGAGKTPGPQAASTNSPR